MKKVLYLFFIVILLVSCSDDDDANYVYEVLPVIEANVPDVFEYGRVYELSITFNQIDDCYVYGDVLYEYDGNARNISGLATYVDRDDCREVDQIRRVFFRVQALQTEDYLFRFWEGDDENGDPIYFEITVPVINFNNKVISESKTANTKM